MSETPRTDALREQRRAGELNISDEALIVFEDLERENAKLRKFEQNRAEGLAAMKASCIDKCHCPPEYVCEYEDGTRHCLHCEAANWWENGGEISALTSVCENLRIENASLRAEFEKLQKQRNQEFSQLNKTENEYATLFVAASKALEALRVAIPMATGSEVSSGNPVVNGLAQALGESQS